MRKKLRAPLTDRARAGIVKELQNICALGDNGAAINIAEYDSGHNIVQVGASFQISGAISATGQNSSAVLANGDVGGRLSLYSTITATDYAAFLVLFLLHDRHGV